MPDTTIAATDILAWAHAQTKADPLPVCSGCPSGQFEQQCWQWVDRLARVVSAASGDVWQAGEPFPGTYAVEHGSERVVIAEVSVVDKVRKLHLMPPAVVMERDRIQELLDGQAEIKEQLRNLHAAMVVRGGSQTAMLQRLLVLTLHYGNAPWVGLLGRFKVKLIKETHGDPPSPS